MQGRALPDFAEVGYSRKDRYVGMFYFLWLGEHGQSGPHDITQILKENPDALDQPSHPAWGPPCSFHHWGQPLFGYYLSDDRWVLRKHAQMLTDAGIDTVIFDVTNGFAYLNIVQALCETWINVREDGNTTPQIAFLCPFGSAREVVRELYDNIYAKGLHKELWFQWKGKPLIMADPATVDEALRDFFTYRKPQGSYFEGPTGPDQWGWLEVYPQHVFKNADGESEQMTVGVAQNAQAANRLSSMSEPNVTGKSWHNGAKDLQPNAVNLGLNFAEQWQRALEIDPSFIFVTGWNEWAAMRLNDFAGVQLPVIFVDQFNQEYSRDIEPLAEGHADSYYYQLVDSVRHYKGVRPQAAANEAKTIVIDGRFGDWTDVNPEYLDDIGDTCHRDHPEWGAAGRYSDTTGRNDIVLCKVARDNKNIYFYVRTQAKLTPQTDASWMRLFINTLGDPNRGWEGYNFVINRVITAKNTSILETSKAGWNWESIGEVSFRTRGCEMELAIPRKALDLDDISIPLRFEFKWADNMQRPNTDEFLLSGDAAPNARFNYLFEE